MKKKTKLSDSILNSYLAIAMINEGKNISKIILKNLFKKYFSTRIELSETKLFTLKCILGYNYEDLKESNHIELIKYNKKFKVIIIPKIDRRDDISFVCLDIISINKENINKFKNYLMNILEYGFKNQIVFEDYLISIDEMIKPLYVSKHKEMLDNEIKKFIRTQLSDNPRKRGLSMLLYGIPGTGKSSYSTHTFFKFKKYINEVCHPDTIYTVNRRIKNFRNKPKYTIVKDEKIRSFNIIVVDEIDMLMSPEFKHDNDQKEIVKLMDNLNSLPNNVIVIFTTNNFENIPESLKRKGRIDINVKFENFDEYETKEYLKLNNINEDNLLSFITNSELCKNENITSIPNNPATLSFVIERYKEKITS